MDLMDSRITRRKPYDSWVKVIPEYGPGFSAQITDLSTGGLAVLNPQPLTGSTFCNVLFILAHGGGQTMVQARCRVTGSRFDEAHGAYHIGLQFVEFVSDEHATKQAITAYLAENH